MVINSESAKQSSHFDINKAITMLIINGGGQYYNKYFQSPLNWPLVYIPVEDIRGFSPPMRVLSTGRNSCPVIHKIIFNSKYSTIPSQSSGSVWIENKFNYWTCSHITMVDNSERGNIISCRTYRTSIIGYGTASSLVDDIRNSCIIFMCQ